MHKAARGLFLARNPFSHPLTQGFFYREKMRAIHRVAPDLPLRDVLEVGGGQSGLTALLYPHARVTNVEVDTAYGTSACNRQEQVRFVGGDATALPFASESFDAVTMFDVLEHIPDDSSAAFEALRVVRPGGYLIVSTPNHNWRSPYHAFMRPICPDDTEMIARWGHARRGYSVAELEGLVGLPSHATATFITPLTVICHDVAFSRLPPVARQLICTALSPVTWIGYALAGPDTTGTETAVAWRKPNGRTAGQPSSRASSIRVGPP